MDRDLIIELGDSTFYSGYVSYNGISHKILRVEFEKDAAFVNLQSKREHSCIGAPTYARIESTTIEHIDLFLKSGNWARSPISKNTLEPIK